MIKINGVEKDFIEPQTITQLVKELGYTPSYVAVERNREIVKRDDFDKQTTADGDEIEIVQFVGGG